MNIYASSSLFTFLVFIVVLKFMTITNLNYRNSVMVFDARLTSIVML